VAAKRGMVCASERQALQEKHKDVLKLPRRPEWTREMTSDQVRAQEEASFLVWRRQLAMCAPYSILFSVVFLLCGLRSVKAFQIHE
jgi:hypothetical protein